MDSDLILEFKNRVLVLERKVKELEDRLNEEKPQNLSDKFV